MAPAGSWESLAAALHAGADAVYFGVDRLNMRSGSRNNFSLPDLAGITAKCCDYGAKSYLTLNTVLFDEDLASMRTLVDRAVESGVSAIIVSDPAVMQYARIAGMPVHISTQMNVTNIEAIRFYAQWADVIVPARELSLEQVSEISGQIREEDVRGPGGHRVRPEVFVHGALCMAVSGKCYLSLHAQNASANRGECIQSCRRPYVVRDKKSGRELEIDNEYIMSAKDLCTIGFLDKVIDAGAELLKIEGRGRSADYVHTTVTCYREAVRAIREGSYTPEKIAHWKKKLATVYNRGFWDGYYLGRTMGEWNDAYGSKATRRKTYIGQCRNYYRKAGAAAFQVETGELEKGDRIMITGPTTGVVTKNVDEMRVDDTIVERVKKGDLFSFAIDEKLRPSDKLYKIVQVA